MIVIIIFGVAIIHVDDFSFGLDSYDIYHHYSTPLPLMIEIIIIVNDDNDGWPLKHVLLCMAAFKFCKLETIPAM